jgi:recombination protein RecR
MKYPVSIQNLIEHFTKLPTVGRKTAERYVFNLLKKDAEELQSFAQAIAELKEKTTVCRNCLAIAETDPCPICRDQKRDKTKLMVLADTRDLLAIESINEFNGRYHVLGGTLNALEGIKPEQLSIGRLLDKIKEPNSHIGEVILATNPNIEGETTALYLTKLLKPFKVKITRLAKGLPTGADLEYADEMTLSNALKYRNEV